MSPRRGFRPGLIERLTRRLTGRPPLVIPGMPPRGPLSPYPPVESWDRWEEYDAKAWPRRVKKSYTLVPTICFNCEAACGLLAYVDEGEGTIRRFEGNPLHPGSRGRNCAKGPATINQVRDPERILYPMRRAGRRGEEKWERITWDEALDAIAARLRAALQEGRHNEIMYHVGRPGHERYMERVLKGWGVDAHNSHTNVCSASARLGYQLWTGSDRPSPDHANARFMLLLSAHLETGHYFNPHAQRIIEAKMKGAKIAVMDPRLSNTASMADYWMPTRPGSEAAVLLAMARIILDEDLLDREFVRRWVNWEQFLKEERPGVEVSFERFLHELKGLYASFTPRFAEEESGVPAARIIEVARGIGEAGSAFAAHLWRGTASGNLGGWQVARALELLSVLVGAVGTRGGTSPASWNKHAPKLFAEPPAQRFWNELLFPASGRWLTTRCRSSCRTSSRKGAGASMSISPASTTRSGPTRTASPGWRCSPTRRRSAVTSRSHRPGTRPPSSPTSCCRWGTRPSGTTCRARRRRRVYGSPSASRSCGPRGSVAARRRSSPGRPTRERSGRRTSSGSSSRGASIPTGRSACAAGSSRRTGRARRSPWRSTTAGCSRTACRACPRRRPRRE